MVAARTSSATTVPLRVRAWALCSAALVAVLELQAQAAVGDDSGAVVTCREQHDVGNFGYLREPLRRYADGPGHARPTPSVVQHLLGHDDPPKIRIDTAAHAGISPCRRGRWRTSVPHDLDDPTVGLP